MIRRRVEKLLLVLGLAAIGVWAWSQLRTSIFQRRAGEAFDRIIHNAPPAPAASPRQAPPVKNGDLLGRLTIPRLKLSAMVREGDGAESLDVALGHIPGTPLPGESGNAAIAGHRDTLFRGLGRVAANDLIQFQTPTGAYSYRVESTEIVTPKDVQVLKPASYSEMTLVTCYPFNYIGSAPDRFIVKARLLPAAAPDAAPKPAMRSAPLLARRDTKLQAGMQTGKVIFHVSEGHSRELAAGIDLGLSSTDPSRQRVSGWLSINPQRQTIWLRDQPTNVPIAFRSDGRIHELVLTAVAQESVTGYLLEPDWR